MLHYIYLVFSLLSFLWYVVIVLVSSLNLCIAKIYTYKVYLRFFISSK